MNYLQVVQDFIRTPPTGAGTGLGLSMVYGFARQSGGQAQIGSEERAGTSVCLYLPRHEGQPDQAPEAPLSSPSGLAGARAADATILVVDDEPSLRLMMADTLREIGYRVLEADNGLRAVEAL